MNAKRAQSVGEYKARMIGPRRENYYRGVAPLWGPGGWASTKSTKQVPKTVARVMKKEPTWSQTLCKIDKKSKLRRGHVLGLFLEAKRSTPCFIRTQFWNPFRTKIKKYNLKRHQLINVK